MKKLQFFQHEILNTHDTKFKSLMWHTSEYNNFISYSLHIRNKKFVCYKFLKYGVFKLYVARIQRIHDFVAQILLANNYNSINNSINASSTQTAVNFLERGVNIQI